MLNGCRESLDKTKRKNILQTSNVNYITVRVLQVFGTHGVDMF